MKIKMIAIAGVAALFAASSAIAGTLEDVRAKGFIQCGVSQGLPGFSSPDDAGKWSGIDVDFCRAMAVAVFNDADAVKFSPLSAKARFDALRSGEIDVLSRNTTWTMTRDAKIGLEFVGVLYYDGQGFMARKSLGVSSATELGGASVCTNTGTTTELNVTDYFSQNNMKLELVAFEKADEVVAAYDAGRCDAHTTDRSGLAAQRAKLKNPDDHVVLPEIISKEPLGPVVREDDANWADLARWTLNVLIESEEHGINSGNVDSMRNSKNPGIRRLLGTDDDLGAFVGVDKDWAYNIIKTIGNYAEVYERNVSPLGLARGVNELWNNGGILYAPPIR